MSSTVKQRRSDPQTFPQSTLSTWDLKPPDLINSNLRTSLWQHFARRVTGIIGLREAITSGHPLLRAIWALLLLLGISITAFFVYDTIQEYLAEPTATKVKLNISDTFDIPPIAVCPSAWWDAEKAYKLGVTPDGLKYSLAYVDDLRGMHLNVSKGRSDFYEFYSRMNFTSLLDYFWTIALDITTVYSSVEFKNMPQVIKLGDPNSTLIGMVFAGYEVCYAYSFRPAGASLSSVAVNVKLSDKTNGTADVIPSVWVELINDLELLGALLPPLYIASFTRTKIQISAHRLVTLNRPGSPCLESGDQGPGESIKAAFGCAVTCQNQEYKKAISCQLLRYSTVSRVSAPSEYCNFLDPKTTNEHKFSDFKLSREHERISDTCMHQCLPRCDKVIYEMGIQWQQWLPVEDPTNKTNTYAELFFEHTARYSGEILAFVEVNTYTFTELVNNVGGTLGLFVGATIMTFAQIILFFLDYIFGRVKIVPEHQLEKAAKNSKSGDGTQNQFGGFSMIDQDGQNLKVEIERLKESNEMILRENRELRQVLEQMRIGLFGRNRDGMKR